MDKSEMVRFLEATELAPYANQGERLDLYLLGRSALILRFGLNLATKDVNIITRGETSILHTKAFERLSYSAKERRSRKNGASI